VDGLLDPKANTGYERVQLDSSLSMFIMSMSKWPFGHGFQVLHGTDIGALALFPNAPHGGYGANDATAGALVCRDPRLMKFWQRQTVGLLESLINMGI